MFSSAKLFTNLTKVLLKRNPTGTLSATSGRFWSSNAKAISLDHDKRHLTVHFEAKNDQPDAFPYTWLRENCRCEECYEPSSMSRVVSLAEFPADVKPQNAEVTSTGECQINWNDGHSSLFPKEFLQDHSFKPESRQRQFEQDSFEQELWTAKSIMENFPRSDYRSIMDSDEGLLDYLLKFTRHGFVIITDVPTEKGHVQKMQNRVAFERMTSYGSGYFVEVKDNPSNISYTHHRISFHNDLTYYDHMPSSVYLHCITQHQGKGGDSLLVDGFKVATVMKEEHPEAFKLLSETIFQFRDIGSDFIDFYNLNRSPMIVHDCGGKLKRINWSQFARDTRMNLPLDQVEPMYAAMRTFESLANNPDMNIEYKLRAGEMIHLNNIRLLHGRTELSGKDQSRLLQGGYIDWDEISSKIRVLQRDLGRM